MKPLTLSLLLLVLLCIAPTSKAYRSLDLASSSPCRHLVVIMPKTPGDGVVGIHQARKTQLLAKKKDSESKFSDKRRKQLGIVDEDEYDLSVALEANTDSTISKIVAGSLIITLLALILVGMVIPLTTDYGEGVCNALLNQGRCY